MSLCWWQERGECVCGYLLLPILNSATVPDNMIWQCSSEEQPIKYGKAILFFNDFKLLYITRVSQEWRVLLQWLKKSEFLTPPPPHSQPPSQFEDGSWHQSQPCLFTERECPFLTNAQTAVIWEQPQFIWSVSSKVLHRQESHCIVTSCPECLLPWKPAGWPGKGLCLGTFST